MKLSEHLTLDEFVASQTAIDNNIENVLPDVYLPKATILAQTIFEPVRLALGGLPLHINSGYRSKALNALLPGASPVSQHCLAEALDILPAIDLKLAFLKLLRSEIAFDQLMLEGFTRDNPKPKWIHISSVVLNPDKNRYQIKLVEMVNGMPVYQQMTKEQAIQKML